MSSKLFWKPVKNEWEPIYESSVLKDIISKKKIRQAGKSSIPYLLGLSDAGVDGASDLINLIATYGLIELKVRQ